MKTFVDWNCHLSRLSTKHSFSIRSVTLSFCPCLSILPCKYQIIRVCCLDVQQDFPLLCLNGLNDLLQGHHFELGACYEAVERLQIHYEVIKTVFQGIHEGVYEKPLFLRPNSYCLFEEHCVNLQGDWILLSHWYFHLALV